MNSALSELEQFLAMMNLLSKQTHEAVSTCVRVACVTGGSLKYLPRRVQYGLRDNLNDEWINEWFDS